MNSGNMCSTFMNGKIENFDNSDYPTTMLASRTFDKILQEIRSSNLNFQLQESPLSAQISLKKSLVKERNGSIRPHPTVSSMSCKDLKIEALETRANNLEEDLKSIQNKYARSVDDLEEAEKKIKELEDQISKPIKSEHDQEVFDLEIKNNSLREEIIDLEKSVDVKIKVSERLRKELGDSKKKAEKEKAAMIKAHRVEVKSWRKDLGEERKQRLKLEKLLEKKLDDPVASTSSILTPMHQSPLSHSEVQCSIQGPGSICGKDEPFPPPTPSKPTLMKNEMCKPLFIPSMVSHWNPNFTKYFQRSSNITTMISHCALLPPPGSSFISMAEVVEAFDQIFAKMRCFS